VRAGARWAVAVLATAAVVTGALVFLRDDRGEDRWTMLPESGIAGRSDPAAVWTGTALIVWGGAGHPRALDDGASYDPVAERWTPLPASPLGARRAHSAVWTGDRMVVFGGQGLGEGCRRACALGDGAAFDPASGTWAAIPVAPIAPRFGHSAVFVRGRMVIWGGAADGGAALGDGASYNVATGVWTVLPPAPIAPRLGHRTVAAADRMLVWSGSNEADEGGRYLADGAVYRIDTNEWAAMAPAPARLGARDTAAGVWTGAQLLVWGGYGRSAECTPCLHADGAAYDLATDTWTPIAGSPLSGRGGHRAVWTGRDMVVWGGFDTAMRADGARYRPARDLWGPVAAGPLAGRQHHAMVWTGRQLLVWGGEGANGKLADGAALTLS
jgi:N-acetylneuraminic acid mutarotase